MDKVSRHNSESFLTRADKEKITELTEISSLLDHGISHLQAAANSFAEIYSEQENKKLNVMKVASMVEVDGEKIKTVDFIMTFNELLAGAVERILDAAKNSMRMTLYLNAVTDSLNEVKRIIVDNPEIIPRKSGLGEFLAQISLDIASCEETLKDVVCIDIDETLDMQTRLSTLLDAFSKRNMQIMQMTGNPPLSMRRMEDALVNVSAELKASRLAKHRIDKMIASIKNGEAYA